MDGEVPAMVKVFFKPGFVEVCVRPVTILVAELFLDVEQVPFLSADQCSRGKCRGIVPSAFDSLPVEVVRPEGCDEDVGNAFRSTNTGGGKEGDGGRCRCCLALWYISSW